MPFGLSYYIFPLAAATVWTGTLMGMIIYWGTSGRPIYPSEQSGQTIAYISDVGAQRLKPLFIAGSAFTVICFDLSFLTEKWLRHIGRLAPNTTISEKIFSFLAAIFSIVGGAGLILLSIFDTYRHPTLHDRFLVIFIGGYLLTAIFTCCEYQRLGMHLRQYRLLRISFWIKLSWVIVFLGLAIGFGVENRRKIWNTAAILEWTIGFLYAFFVASFAIDFFPAIRKRGHHKHFPTKEELKHSTAPHNHFSRPAYDSDSSFGHNQQPVAENARSYQPQPARNF